MWALQLLRDEGFQVYELEADAIIEFVVKEEKNGIRTSWTCWMILVMDYIIPTDLCDELCMLETKSSKHFKIEDMLFKRFV